MSYEPLRNAFCSGLVLVACGSDSAPSDDANCFVGTTTQVYSGGLIAAGACTNSSTVRCINDLDCGSGTCTGAQDQGEGIADANALCAAEFPGALVCTVDDTYDSEGCPAPPSFSGDAWVFGQENCVGWSSDGAFGTVWVEGTHFIQGNCGNVRSFACCAR
jgi:hypothetical protein